MSSKFLAMALAAGCLLSLGLNHPPAEAKDVNKLCNKLTQRILKKQYRGQSVNSNQLARYQYYCSGYGSSDGYGYSQSYGDPYSGNYGYSQSYSYQSPGSYSQGYGYPYSGSYGPSATIATPNSQVQIQGGGMVIQTPTTGIRVGY
ncbi:hypothetical protein [Gloeobacter kilaueensis]|uniref:Peptidase M23 n=1 Tax=Gloeobacter kilaueensis (strain ATCC BAA-2537 / CCAP 1431/1 / ULC 316 / JS1) TaxID=1183438 RepID=U5QM90_GLOK1|nr:hypothetical protein [Gloeobacter kilaueensis]AGY59993.1 peptidase M23 [Gloeobacter kilaueensis JS1]